MTIKNIRYGLVALLIGAVISILIFFLVLQLRGPDVLIMTGVPLATLVEVFSPHALGTGSRANAYPCTIFRIQFYCGDEHRLYMLCAWIQFSVYFGLIANQMLSRLTGRSQATLTTKESIPGAWMRPNDDSRVREGANQPSQTTHRALKLVGGFLMTSIGIGLLYIASLFGLNGWAGVPGLIFIWLGLFFFLAKKGGALTLLSIASILMLGFVVLGWIGIRTALGLRFS